MNHLLECYISQLTVLPELDILVVIPPLQQNRANKIFRLEMMFPCSVNLSQVISSGGGRGGLCSKRKLEISCPSQHM